MTEDMLVKATEALQKWLADTGCRTCFSRPLGCPDCLMIANCVVRRLASDAELGAHAVLEAVKYDKLEAVVEALRDFYDNCQCLECAPKRGEEQCEQDPCWGDNLIDALAVLEQAEGVKTDALPTS